MRRGWDEKGQEIVHSQKGNKKYEDQKDATTFNNNQIIMKKFTPVDSNSD